MTDATSNYLNQPTRSHEEYLAEKARRIREWRDWIEANPDPVLKGSAAIGAAHVAGLNARDRRVA